MSTFRTNVADGPRPMRRGRGGWLYLSRETVRWLKIWLDHAKISEGPIFRRLIGRDQIGDVLHPGSIAPIFKRVAQWIGMPARFVAEGALHAGGRRAGSRGARYRLGGDHASRRVEVDSDAAAVCGEDQCGAV